MSSAFTDREEMPYLFETLGGFKQQANALGRKDPTIHARLLHGSQKQVADYTTKVVELDEVLFEKEQGKT